MIIHRGHESVLEHASATFRISGVSRALTHQLLRHCFCFFIQKSQRYINEDNFSYVEPYSIKNIPKAHALFANLMDEIKTSYERLRRLGIKKEDARFILPNSAVSDLVFTSNFRELRYLIKLRGENAAQWEIRNLVIEMLHLLKKEVPEVFLILKLIVNKKS
ncbi:MAG: Thymidylate synthase, flavin-dependent [Promethearchaeota archaeon]|nr:MAG: Thymidylate synthase, flavin-dependent [Candidatus Lokiarchaeota archaeon]